jgi:hypothetical protein
MQQSAGSFHLDARQNTLLCCAQKAAVCIDSLRLLRLVGDDDSGVRVEHDVKTRKRHQRGVFEQHLPRSFDVLAVRVEHGVPDHPGGKQEAKAGELPVCGIPPNLPAQENPTNETTAGECEY